MNKQPEMTEKTRRAFVDAFCQLYIEKPIEKITINEITRMAGYNRSTFYQYFKDIYELLIYLETYLLDTIKHTLEEKMKTTPIELVYDEAFIQTFIDIFDENSLYFSALMGINGNVRYTETVRNELKEMISNVVVPAEDSKYVLYLLDFYSSAFFSMITCWFRNNQDISTDELGRLIQNIVKLGVVPVMSEYGLNPLKQFG